MEHTTHTVWSMAMRETTDRLDAIEARLGTITPGPWEARDWTTVDIDGAPVHCEVRIWSSKEFVAGVLEGQDSDAEFISNAPSDVHYLLTLARKQAAALEAVTDRLDEWAAMKPFPDAEETQVWYSAGKRHASEAVRALITEALEATS